MPSTDGAHTRLTIPERQSLSDSVYDIVLERLMSGEIPAESSVNIDHLSRTLGVSQTPIREALARLESTGLVTRAALRGYRVAPLFTPRQINDLMEARVTIESRNASLAAVAISADALAVLRDSIVALRDSPKGPGFTEIRQYWDADEQFHDVIAREADNHFLLAAFHSLGGHVQRFRLFGDLRVTDAEHAIAEHTAILHELESGRSAGAAKAMERHIRSVQRRANIDRRAIDV
jgi:DNA-binding GntR family transcriptional regulator